MGLITAEAMIDRAQLDLLDPGEATWTRADLLADLNEAIAALCGTKSDSYVVTDDMTLDPGTVQGLPEGGFAIVNVLENSGSGAAISLVDRELLDARPGWTSMTPTAAVRHWMADPRNKDKWRCYPPNSGAGSVLITFAAVPSDITEYEEAIPVGDEYEPPLYAYMLGAAYRRNTLRQDLGKTDTYMAKFLQLLGLAAGTQIAIAPRVSQSPGV